MFSRNDTALNCKLIVKATQSNAATKVLPKSLQRRPKKKEIFKNA